MLLEHPKVSNWYPIEPETLTTGEPPALGELEVGIFLSEALLSQEELDNSTTLTIRAFSAHSLPEKWSTKLEEDLNIFNYNLLIKGIPHEQPPAIVPSSAANTEVQTTDSQEQTVPNVFEVHTPTNQLQATQSQLSVQSGMAPSATQITPVLQDVKKKSNMLQNFKFIEEEIKFTNGALLPPNKFDVSEINQQSANLSNEEAFWKMCEETKPRITWNSFRKRFLSRDTIEKWKNSLMAGNTFQVEV